MMMCYMISSFNHKTGAEDVHFTAVFSHLESEDEDIKSEENDFGGDGEQLMQDPPSKESSSIMGDEPTVLQMIIVKDVKAGVEVFNTYGSLGNAALLHRYGFTEPDNSYDIVNIDLELVFQWSSSLFSSRHSRSRLSLWRRLNYSGCVSQNSEYFEISYGGEPQVELLILVYIILLPEEAYRQLDLTSSTFSGNSDKPLSIILLARKGNISMEASSRPEMLLTKSVRDALLSLADIRESLYGSNSVEEDIKTLKSLDDIRERKLYHSLMLRVSERRILERLRTYAGAGGTGWSFGTGKKAAASYTRKKMKMPSQNDTSKSN